MDARRDCHLGITSRAIVRDNAVGPFQKNAALKVWSKCNKNEKSLDESCLRDDYVAKLRNRTNAEIKELKECHRTMPTESLGKCLGVNILAQRKLYKKMEDAAFVYRSMYHEHLQHWLKFYAPAQLLVLASESFFEPTTIKPTMQRFARFLGLADAGTMVDDKLLTSASPASTANTPHENGRVYIAETPPDVAASLRAFLCPKTKLLAELLSRHRLANATELPWLPPALKECESQGGGGGGGGAAAEASRAAARPRRRRGWRPRWTRRRRRRERRTFTSRQTYERHHSAHGKFGVLNLYRLDRGLVAAPASSGVGAAEELSFFWLAAFENPFGRCCAAMAAKRAATCTRSPSEQCGGKSTSASGCSPE